MAYLQKKAQQTNKQKKLMELSEWHSKAELEVKHLWLLPQAGDS